MLCSAARAAAFTPLKITSARRAAESRRGVVVRASGPINPDIKKDVDKVVDSVSLNDLDGKKQVSYCRCWRSATFPLCNGAHVAHNKASGDNVGPLLVKASE
ncbi:hypothetical protein D9Q98_003208 [Chlorella vulgaris]|uniref:Iron-binding zinc finger CDGSH type domain-containing protein n=1 Tax=Chlorella vulgaris TaxID=3077 RepID=A0A9D4TSB6_CHLVU|nr:hypothetical protein D9Q98_003208 [Chlorella vulgaris]